MYFANDRDLPAVRDVLTVFCDVFRCAPCRNFRAAIKLGSRLELASRTVIFSYVGLRIQPAR
jgi:hypothetical protein